MLKCRVGGQWQAQDFLGPKCRFRGRRRTLCAELVAGAGLCGPWSADSVAGAGLFDVEVWQVQDFVGLGVQIWWQAQDFVDLEVQISWQV